MFMVMTALFAGWLIDLDKVIKARMQSQHWAVPAKVYARPLELFVGSTLSPDQLRQELELLGYKRLPGSSPGFYSIAAEDSSTTFTINTRHFEFTDLEAHPAKLTLRFTRQRLSGLDLDTEEVDVFRLEPLLIGSIHPTKHEDREIVTLDQLPDGFEETLIEVEDRRFRDHAGISIRGIVRAVLVNTRSGSRSQGASTITQQLIKNLFLTSEKSYSRKITEAFMALLMEVRYSKDTILELFINEVFLAQDGNRAIHGFGLASRYFFDRPLSELDTANYSLLIGMIKAPSSYNPIRHPERAKGRRNVVIEILAQRQHLPVDAAELIKKQPLGLSSTHPLSAGNPAYLDLVRRQLVTEYSLQDLQTADLRIFTNYDPLLQQQVESSVEKVLSSLDPPDSSQQSDTGTNLQAAVILTDTNTGDVKAVLGGRKQNRGTRGAGFNRALDAKRPVGSILKPAVYLTAWQHEETYTLGTLIPDESLAVKLPNGDIWRPENYNGKEHGPVLMIDALAYSLNLATAKLGLELGIDEVISTLQRLGLSNELPEVPALLLGATELSVFDVLQMYQTIASSGYNMPVRAIREVVDASGDTLSQYNIEIKDAFSRETMHLLRYAMTETMRQGTGRSVYSTLDANHQVAGKTGTSNEQRDSWFAGFSDDLLAVVWVGNDDNLPTSVTGSTGALPIWTDIFNNIPTRSLGDQTPTQIATITIDPKTGKRTRENCESAVQLPFILGSEPVKRVTCKGRGSRINRWLKSLLD